MPIKDYKRYYNSVFFPHTSFPHYLQDGELLMKLERRVSGAASPSPLLKLLEGSQPVADELLLLEDLQHSSSSSSGGSSGSDSDMDQD